MPEDHDIPNHTLRVLEKIQASAADTNAKLEALTVEVRDGLAALIVEMRASNARVDQLVAFTANGFTALGEYTVEGFAEVNRRIDEATEQMRSPADRNLEARVRTIEDHLRLPHG